MNKDKLQRIVDSVHAATTNGSLVWKLTTSMFNNDTTHKFESISEDGVTRFTCTISLNRDLTLYNVLASLNISNPSIIDGSVDLRYLDYKNISEIHEYIYKNQVLPNLKISDQDKVMDDILKGVDVSEYRDKKIDTILDNIATSVDNHTKAKKSLFKRIFR
jgi:hypothetical protein